MKKLIILIAMAASLSFAVSEPQTHDGFFLNWTFGLGFQSFDYIATDHDDLDMKASGIAAETDFLIGGRIANNTLLHVSFVAVKNLNDIERFKKNGTKYDQSNGISEQMNLFGLGATYYLPSNIFFTASAGLAWFSIEVDNCSGNCTAGSSDAGFGFQVGAGKEWWVGAEWGIGAKLALTYGSASDQDDAGDLSAFGVNLMFSVTFN